MPEQLEQWAANEAVERAYARLALARALSERQPQEYEVELARAEQHYVDTWTEVNREQWTQLTHSE